MEPVGHVRAVVAVFGWLDVVEEALVDDGLPGGCHRSEQVRRALRIAAGHHATPRPEELGSAVGRPVRLKFALFSAKLFAFQFRE